MMVEEKMRVRAVARAKVPFRDADGRLVHWRFVARERVYPHKVIDGGEELTVTAHNRNDVLRAIADGDLERVSEAVDLPPTTPTLEPAELTYATGETPTLDAIKPNPAKSAAPTRAFVATPPAAKEPQ